MGYNGTIIHDRMNFLYWLNDIQNEINNLLKYNYDFSIKENVISLNWYKNRKEISISRNLLKEILKIGIDYNFQLPSFMVEQYGDMIPELKTYNDYLINSNEDE